MKPIAVFYHCLLTNAEGHALVNALSVVKSQMDLLAASGLPMKEFHIGVNGSEESEHICQIFFPGVNHRHMHGLQCKNECRTILELEKWLPGHKGWNVLYFHSKGATYPPGDAFSGRWRDCMMSHLVWNWQRCVQDLESVQSVGCHWMTPEKYQDVVHQPYWGGNFWWAHSDYLMTLPKLMDCGRIKTGQSKLDDHDTRFEAEVWVGAAKQRPSVRDYHPGWQLGSALH